MDYKLTITRQDTTTRVIDSGSQKRCQEQLDKRIADMRSAAYILGYYFEEMKTYQDYVTVTGAVVLFGKDREVKLNIVAVK